MRQTLFLPGVVETLPALIGDGKSDFSVQSSMLENFERVCKALLSNSSTGRVMSGLKVSIGGVATPPYPGSTMITVGFGYAIANSGKMIVLARSMSTAYTPSANATFKLYLKYVGVLRGSTASSPSWQAGGRTSWINKDQNQSAIISDSLGASSTDPDVGVDIILVDPADTADTVYLGAIQVDTGGANGVFIANGVGDDVVEFKTSFQCESKIWTSSGFISSMTNDTFMLLPPGRKRLKQINLLYQPATSTRRYEDKYRIQMRPNSFSVVAGESGIGSAFMLQDLTSRSYMSQDINLILDDGVVGIYLTAASNGVADYASATANSIVEYIIEKLN